MNIFAKCKNSCFRKLFNANILAGLGIALVAFLLMVTGDYSNLTERRNWDAIYNVLIFGGLLYAAVFWYVNTFARDLIAKSNEES
ncbi:MAG: hypothetical protein OEZ10_10720 [Gammaproteobacteria bacterium]|nr:hypothetical protein [Gammaproteobacteria bacterium]